MWECSFKMDSKPLFFLFILAALLLTPGCLESNNTITPPFTEGQFYNKVTDLNYSKVKVADYNNMVLVFNGNKISVADVNDLNLNIPNIPVHNALSGLQGGAVNEYYHLTQAQNTILDDLDNNIDYGIIVNIDGNICIGYINGVTC